MSKCKRASDRTSYIKSRETGCKLSPEAFELIGEWDLWSPRRDDGTFRHPSRRIVGYDASMRSTEKLLTQARDRRYGYPFRLSFVRHSPHLQLDRFVDISSRRDILGVLEILWTRTVCRSCSSWMRKSTSFGYVHVQCDLFTSFWPSLVRCFLQSSGTHYPILPSLISPDTGGRFQSSM